MPEFTFPGCCFQPQEEWLVSFHLGGMLWFISLMKMRMRMRMNLLIWNDHFYLIHNSLQLMRSKCHLFCWKRTEACHLVPCRKKKKEAEILTIPYSMSNAVTFGRSQGNYVGSLKLSHVPFWRPVQMQFFGLVLKLSRVVVNPLKLWWNCDQHARL